MGKITDYINTLKEKRNLLKQKQEEEYQKRINNDTIQFYEDSMNMEHYMDGLVILIMDDSSYREKANKGFTHLKVVQQLFRELGIPEHLSSSSTDYGEELAGDHHCVFIRACSVEAGPTILYCPESCSDYQIEQLKKYNEEVKEFSLLHKGHEIQLCFRINNQEYENVPNIDILIEEIEKRRKTK